MLGDDAGEDTSRLAHQAFQHGTFFSCQVDDFACAYDPPRDGIECEIGDLQHSGFGRIVRSTGERAPAGQQLFERKGFDEVIVCTSIQPGYPLIHCITGGKRQDRPVDADPALFTANRQAVHLGQEDRARSGQTRRLWPNRVLRVP